MNPNQRKTYIGTIEESLKFLGNQVFAEISQILLEVKTNSKLERRGQTISGEAVGYIVDSNSTNFDIVAEYSCEKDYFNDKKLQKIKKDIGHCLSIAPNCSYIYLLANSSCGPKKYTHLLNLLLRFGKLKKKEIILFDARLISEFIVDEIIDKQDTINIEKLSYQIPSLKQIKNEHTYTNTLPEPIINNVERAVDENSIIELLKKNKIVQLYGISGIGKTYLSIQIVNKIIKSDWNAIWISGADIKSPDNLLSFQINRYGVPQNVIGLMNRFKCFLIIDSLETNIDETIEYLQNNVQNDFKTIITSQIASKFVSKFKVNHLDKKLSSKVLNNGIKTSCPDEILIQIIKKLGGHPFILNQINILIRNGELFWHDLIEELEHITSTEDELNQPFYDKLFANHLKPLKEELKCLQWISSKTIERSLLKSLIGITGIQKLEKRDFFNISNKTFIILHDIVFNSLKKTESLFDESLLELKLKKTLEDDYLKYNPNYYRIIHSHYDLILKILTKSRENGIFCYSYLQSVRLEEFNENILPDFNHNYLSDLFNNYNKIKYFEVFSWIEYIEVKYRLMKLVNIKNDEVKKFLEGNISNLINYIENSQTIPKSVMLEIQNHIGKFQRNMGNRKLAIETFENILKTDSKFWAAKFHLAKLLRKDDDTMAQKLLTEILNSYGIEDKLSSTIVLASFKEIRSHKVLDNLFLSKFIDIFDNLINETMVDNFDLPYEVLGALSSKIAFNNPQKLINLAESLPIPSETNIDNNTLFDIGQIYFNVSKAYLDIGNKVKSLEYSNQSIVFYEKLHYTTSYQKRFIAESYILTLNYKEALAVLLEVPEKDREIWWNYSHAKILRLNKKYGPALIAIEICFDLKPSDKTTFYWERAFIKKELNDITFKDDFQLALHSSKTGKFQDMIKDEIKNTENLYLVLKKKIPNNKSSVLRRVLKKR